MLNKLGALLALSVLLTYCSPKEEITTREEAVRFAKKLEYSLEKGNEHTYDSLFNIGAFASKVSQSTGNKLNSGYIAGVSQALTKSDLGKMIISRIKDNGSYSYLRTYQKDGRQHVVFRFFQGNGFNYHDYELVKFQGEVKIADLFDYMTGQNFTKTIGQLLGTLDEFSKQTNDMLADRSAKEMVQIKTLVFEKKFEEAKKHYDRLPDSYKKEKIFQTMHLQITSGMGDDIYKEALAEYEQLYSDDPSSQLALIDAYFYKQEYSKAMRAVDKLDSAIGGDPMMNYYRALLISQAGDEQQAIKYLEALHRDMPDFEEGAIELIARYIDNSEEDNAGKLMREYIADKRLDQSKLESIRILYPEFAASYDF